MGYTFSSNGCKNSIPSNLFLNNGVATIPAISACNNYFFSGFTFRDSLKCFSNDFAIEFKIINAGSTGGISDYDTYFELFAKNNLGNLKTSLAIIDSTGRLQFTSASVGNNGTSNNPALLQNVQRWRVINIHYINNQAIFSIDGTTMVTIPYSNSMTIIDSLAVSFKGSGQLDWIRAINNNVEIWREDFASNNFTHFPILLCNQTPTCSDTCFWRVTGNNILTNANGDSKNIFGTLNNFGIRILTNNIDRGSITSNGWFGWNTIPSTLFHIKCNPPSRGFGPSSIRFQDLPSKLGDILVTDENGYVYKSTLSVKDLNDRVEYLETQLQMLSKRLNSIQKIDNNGYLKQNIPNPISNRTTIEYGILKANGPSYLLITDLTGKQILKVNLINETNGKLDLDTTPLISGLYLYSLIIGNDVIDTKKMVIQK